MVRKQKDNVKDKNDIVKLKNTSNYPILNL